MHWLRSVCGPPGTSLAVLFLLVPFDLSAHHAGLYDENAILDLEGRIVAVSWRNPHVRIALDVAADDGTTTRWELEGTSVNALERWSLAPTDLPIGGTLVARGPTSRGSVHAIVGARVIVNGGAPISLFPVIASRLGIVETGIEGNFPAPEVTSGHTVQANGIFRVWTPRRQPHSDPATLPLTARAREIAASYDPLADDPALACMPPGMPAMLATPYPIEFVDRGDHIVMRLEEWGAMRTIHLSPGRGPAVQEPSPYGVSFGRWERNGATLAVFTLYIDYPYLDDHGTPQSGAVTVLERYTPSVDGNRLDWELTITDSAMLTEPVVQRGHMDWEPGESVKAFDCLLAPSWSDH